jgi:RecB family endonuclease NucS
LDGRIRVQAIEESAGVTTVGKIKRVPLREVWKHEALDFTAWLRENIDVLNDALNLSLSNAERERGAGDFSVDPVTEDESGDPVIVENQLEKSDHDHLGKLLTYLVAIGAKTAVNGHHRNVPSKAATAG